MIEQPPPFDENIEKAILGAILLEREAMYKISGAIRPEFFYRTEYQVIYETIQELFRASEPIDILIVTNSLRKAGKLEQAGGAFCVTECTEDVNSSANIESHAAIVKELWIKRELITKSHNIHYQAYDDTEDALSLLDNSLKSLQDIAKTLSRGRITNTKELAYDTLQKAINDSKQQNKLVGIPTGFVQLDRFTGGWKAPDLTIIAARPGMGKTAFVLESAKVAAVKHNIPVALFSLEMSAEQCMQRLISSTSEVELGAIIQGKLTTEQIPALEHHASVLMNDKLVIDDTPGLTILELKGKCHAIKGQYGLGMIIVDYLQLMNGEGRSREEEISRISRGLKQLAKDFGVPVIALSQLSRAVESRGGDKKPQLSDLRESGAIEQDADMVCFLYRPETYRISEIEIDGSMTATNNVAMLLIEKHRNGPTGNIPLRFIGRYTKFMDYYQTPQPAPPPPIQHSLLDPSEPLKEQTNDPANNPPF